VGFQRRGDGARAKFDGQAKLLQTLGYHNVLARGFALVRGADGAMLRRAAEVMPGSPLDIEFADGHVSAHADDAARKPEPESKAKRPRGDDKQGSLL
jgi:exodeoxyribonuclease VII large subunit